MPASFCQVPFTKSHAVSRVKFRYPGDTSVPVPRRHFPAGLAGGVDPVGFAPGVGERTVGFHRIVFHRMDSKQFPVL